ncbi:cytochrome P450 [Mycena olivaceomarginata]|nr:cytochrome P450 [Mycena olivaceomarginata]
MSEGRRLATAWLRFRSIINPLLNSQQAMDPTSLALGASLLAKPTPLAGHPAQQLKWFKGAITYAFDDTAIAAGARLTGVVVGLGASWASRILASGRLLTSLVNRASEFDRSKSISALFAGTLPQGMLALPTEEQFKHHKRYLGITMTNPYLARMTPRIVDLMQELVDLWALGAKRLSTPTAAIDVLDDIRLATIDVIASITFGASFQGVRMSLDYLEAAPTAPPSARPPIPKLAADLEVLLDTIGDGVLFPAPRLLPWLTRTFNRKWRRAITSTHDYLRGRLYAARADYAVEGRDAEKAAANKADNVLDMIMEREKEDRAKGAEVLTEAEIIDELTTFALGGSETTATTMQWSVKILCKHPSVQHTLRAELLAQLPFLAPGSARAPTYAEVSDETALPYLTAVLYEILRCSRTASAVARDATRDTTLLGYPIPKGTQQCESDASRDVTDSLDSVRSASSRGTDPERWLRADGSFDAHAGPWLPFSYGMRAMIELRLFLSMITVNFFFDAVPAELNTWKSHETVTNHPAQCYVRPIPWEELEGQKGGL